MFNPASVGSEWEVMAPLTSASQFSVSSTIILGGRPAPPSPLKVKLILFSL